MRLKNKEIANELLKVISGDDIIEFFKSEGKIRFDELAQKNISLDSVFDSSAYERFLKLSGISKVINPVDVLLNLDCGIMNEGFVFNNAGILFFSKEPMKLIKHASVICALYKGIDKVMILDKKDLQGNMIDIIEDSIIFLKKHLNVRYENESPRSKLRGIWLMLASLARKAITARNSSFYVLRHILLLSLAFVHNFL